MTELFHSYTRYKSEKIGKIYDVLICEMAKDGEHYVGHNKCYEHILVAKKDGDDLLGKWAKVKITEVAKFYMKSIILKEKKEGSKMQNFMVISIIALLAFILMKMLSFYEF